MITIVVDNAFAGRHSKYGPSLQSPGEGMRRLKTNPSTYSPSNPLALQPKGEFEMPMGIGQMSRFEEMDLKINILEYGNKELVPNRVSKKCYTDFDVDLFLLRKGLTHHYMLITNLKSLICRVNGRTLSSRDCHCRNCCHICSSKEIYERHIVSCFNNEPTLVQMPKPEKNKMQVTNIQDRWFALIYIHFY